MPSPLPLGSKTYDALSASSSPCCSPRSATPAFDRTGSQAQLQNNINWWTSGTCGVNTLQMPALRQAALGSAALAGNGSSSNLLRNSLMVPDTRMGQLGKSCSHSQIIGSVSRETSPGSPSMCPKPGSLSTLQVPNGVPSLLSIGELLKKSADYQKFVASVGQQPASGLGGNVLRVPGTVVGSACLEKTNSHSQLQTPYGPPLGTPTPLQRSSSWAPSGARPCSSSGAKLMPTLSMLPLNRGASISRSNSPCSPRSGCSLRSG